MDDPKEPREPGEPAEPQVRVVDRRWWARAESAEGAGQAPVLKPTYVEELERELTDTRSRLQEFMTEHRRSLEEFEQVKVRIRRDVAREVDRGKRALLADLLDVLDNLERAALAAREAAGSPAGTAVDTITRGVELVRDQFLARLEGFGVSRVPAHGQPFDAALHEAITTAPVTDAAQEGLVVAVIKEGYAIGNELLRPASVVVGRVAD